MKTATPEKSANTPMSPIKGSSLAVCGSFFGTGCASAGFACATSAGFVVSAWMSKGPWIASGRMTFGVFSFGLHAVGSVALGGRAFGAISIGHQAAGAIAIGNYACGAVAVGRNAASGSIERIIG